MVSLSSSGSLLFPLATKSVSSRLSRLANSDKKPVNSFCYKVKEEQRKVVCACVAPPRDLGTDGFPATKFNDSSKSENVNTLFEAEDDGDVLIECRNVYKSFGEKHILRGVSFKLELLYKKYMEISAINTQFHGISPISGENQKQIEQRRQALFGGFGLKG